MQNRNYITFDRVKQNYRSRNHVAMRNIAFIAAEFFRENFKKGGVQNGAFTPWKQRKFEFPGKRRQLLYKGGDLFRGIQHMTARQKAIVFNNVNYALIHQQGGEIPVTPAMRRFFWAMAYKAGAGKTLKKDGTPGNNQNNRSLDAAGEIWRNLALTKKQTLTVPARPIFYHSRDLEAKIEWYIDSFIISIQR